MKNNPDSRIMQRERKSERKMDTQDIGTITTGTLVVIAFQIALALKWLIVDLKVS